MPMPSNPISALTVKYRTSYCGLTKIRREREMIAIKAGLTSLALVLCSVASMVMASAQDGAASVAQFRIDFTGSGGKAVVAAIEVAR